MERTGPEAITRCVREATESVANSVPSGATALNEPAPIELPAQRMSHP